MKTTLNKIRKHSPCADGWQKLLAYLGKTQADDEPLPIVTILESNGLDDALWCLRAVDGYDRELRLYAVWCARRVQHLMTDPQPIAALDVAERYANGQATDEERAGAWSTARSAAWPVAWSAAESAARSAARSALWPAAGLAAESAAWSAAQSAGYDTERSAQADELRRLCAEIESRETTV